MDEQTHDPLPTVFVIMRIGWDSQWPVAVFSDREEAERYADEEVYHLREVPLDPPTLDDLY